MSGKSKGSCLFGGISSTSTCSEGSGAWGEGNKIISIMECNLDISSHLLKFGLWSDMLKNCPKVSESWLIINRLSSISGTVSDTSLICPKHRWENGIGWKGFKSCVYPDHQKTKGKCSSQWRKISPTVASEIFQLFSSTAKPVHIPIGSTWCNNCRLRVHPKLIAQNKQTLGTHPCAVCEEYHEQAESDIMFTPNKRLCLEEDLDSDAEYSPGLSSRKDTLNESMKNLDSQWTPVKYQLQKDYGDLSEKTRQKLVRKSLSAISTVFESIAPGQSEKLRAACLSTEVSSSVIENIQHAVDIACGRNNKIQLISILCKKDSQGSYEYTIKNLLELFPGTTKHDIEKARKHAAIGRNGMPIETGKYYRTRVTTQQINHFLDFLQFSGIVQDVASGTRSIKLSTGVKSVMPNVVRTVHKAEIVRLYEAACNEEGYYKETGRPSTRTIWNILNNCPSSQRKSLSGLDNIAAEGSDAFENIIDVLQEVINKRKENSDHITVVIDGLVQGKRYLKGDYKAHCADEDGSNIADHCRIFALSDSKNKIFQKACSHSHNKFCDDCENLEDALTRSVQIVTDCDLFATPKEKANSLYEATTAVEKINIWKGHILATIHQEKQKNDIIANLDHETVFFIIDFAMKVLPKRYRESMAKWFGKKGNGMHVACAILKDEVGELLKKTYIVFIGTAPQDVGTVMAIYVECLKQVKTDFPHLKYIIDKSDNAGCYHNEAFFFWKATWACNVSLKFLETMFNERQSGKDQCDRDSATAKRQMKYYIESGRNIESAAEMNEALRTSTALCGFNSCVLEIEEKKEYGNKEKTVTDISKIHSIKYLYDDNDKPSLHVWQFYNIGKGKVFPVSDSPIAPQHTVTTSFEAENVSFGKAKKQHSEKEVIYCPEVTCIQSFSSVMSLRKHLDFGKHTYTTKNASQIEKVKDMWVDRFSVGSSKTLPKRQFEGVSQNKKITLKIGWAIAKRVTRRLTLQQKTFLNKLFDEGEITNKKVTPNAALSMFKDEFDVKDYLPLNTIKSYFSRRARAVRDGKVIVGENQEDMVKGDTNEEDIYCDDSDNDDDVGETGDNEDDDDDDDDDEERENQVKMIEMGICKIPDLHKDDWIAVAFPGVWFPGQFCSFDNETEEIEVHFVDRPSSNTHRFVWPELSGKKEDRSWVDECNIIYKLPQPSAGKRNTLEFTKEVTNEVEGAFQEWKSRK